MIIEAEVDPRVPRVVATDAGDRWEWIDGGGWRTSRDKMSGPLPAMVNEIHHRRAWCPGDEYTERFILLLPPRGAVS